jgi:hypothetical protein
LANSLASVDAGVSASSSTGDACRYRSPRDVSDRLH